MHLWDVATGRELAEFDTGEIVHNATFSPDGSRIATASLAGRILIWDVASKTRDRASSNIPMRAASNSVQSEGRSPGGEFDSRHRTVVERGDWRRSRHYPDKLGAQVVFNPDGNLVLAATSDNAAHLLKTDGTELKKLVGHEGRITGAAFSPDGQLVATASLDHTARIWSVKDGSSVATLKGHRDELTTVMFSPGRSVTTDCLTRRHRANLERSGRERKGSCSRGHSWRSE